MNTLDEKQRIFNAFADKSVAANESAELDKFIDDKKFGKMIEEEIERINIKEVPINPRNKQILTIQNHIL